MPNTIARIAAMSSKACRVEIFNAISMKLEVHPCLQCSDGRSCSVLMEQPLLFCITSIMAYSLAWRNEACDVFQQIRDNVSLCVRCLRISMCVQLAREIVDVATRTSELKAISREKWVIHTDLFTCSFSLWSWYSLANFSKCPLLNYLSCKSGNINAWAENKLRLSNHPQRMIWRDKNLI